MLLLLLEAAAALALVEYVRRELPALGAGAADGAARRATRHHDTCELTAIAAEAQHRPPSSFSRLRVRAIRQRVSRADVLPLGNRYFQEVFTPACSRKCPFRPVLGSHGPSERVAPSWPRCAKRRTISALR